MTSQIVFIREIKQVDSYHFAILWTDGAISNYRLSEIQKNCPCALCRDEKSGKSLVSEDKIDQGVRAYKITSVGRYALRIAFVSGCSEGIYSFALLRSMTNAK